MYVCVSIAGSFIFVSLSTNLWFYVVLIPIIFLYYRIQKFYINSSREIQRLSSISNSPIYAFFSETLDGLTTMRAFGNITRFKEKFQKLVNRNCKVNFAWEMVARWLALRMELTGIIIQATVALVAVLGKSDASDNEQYAAIAGLSISFAFGISNGMKRLIFISSDLENNMVSVERVDKYIKLEGEGIKMKNLEEAEIEELKEVEEEEEHDLPPNWPTIGDVDFHQVSMKYREGLPNVLNSISFSISGGLKVGVVGRTGAGKSSLISCLLRLVDVCEGVISIDGVDISSLPKTTLRSSIAIIPQDPVLFSGTIRENVDPFSSYSDQEIWDALSKVQLKEYVNTLTDIVDEGGQNFSVGQAQLICVARALLSRSKVIVLDEATAAIDVETDRVIQNALRDGFRDSTCITIAHRINTIMDSDRILVMDQGQVAEYDSPSNLLKNPTSIFTSLVNKWND